MNQFIITQTGLGPIKGLDCEDYYAYLGVRFATARRFSYAVPIDAWEGEYDATHMGNACPQTRTYYPHLEVPERLFYHNEFRKDQTYSYNEDCLNLNIFVPKDHVKKHPVLVYIHGGGFNSGASYDSAIQGQALTRYGLVLVSIQYRVGVLGYLTHEEVEKECGREGNFGLDDQLVALRWIKNHIADFAGDPDNITVSGQSAGAISIQYLCLSEKTKGLFQHAIMASGGGMFPKFALPRQAVATREYWLDLMQEAGVNTLDQFKALELDQIFAAVERIKARRKDNTYNTMPVVDGYLIEKPVDELIAHPHKIDYMVGYTNNDMYASIMAHISHKYAKANDAYLYYFDIDAPGEDNNAAFHSSDIRYFMGTLSGSDRPYDTMDQQISQILMQYFANFAKTGNPNGANLPSWQKATKGKALCLRKPLSSIKMGKPNQWKLLHNMLTKGDPK